MKKQILFKDSDIRIGGSVDMWNGWDAATEFGMYAENFVLAEFDEFDRSSAVCRYPVTSDGKPSMQEQRCVNLFEFAETMEALLELVIDLSSTVPLEVERYFSALSYSAGY